MLLIPIAIVTLAHAGTTAETQPVQPADPVLVPAPPAPPVPPVPPPPTPTISRPPQPKGNIAGWVTNSDYPKELRGGESGVTGFRLLIGRDGKPKDCTITMSSGNPVLDARTCEILMKRANFEPAHDGYYRKLEGSYSSRVRWIAPTPKGFRVP